MHFYGTTGFGEGGPAMFPGFPANLDYFEEEMLAEWTEDQKKEREVILNNRYTITSERKPVYGGLLRGFP